LSFITELKRRNVFRIAVGYVVLAWLMAQVAEFLLDTFGAPAWVLKALLVIFLVGFPFALFFAWAYELTPEGLKREAEVDRSRSVVNQTGRKIDRAIIVALMLALAWFAWDRFTPAVSERDSAVKISEPTGTATDESTLNAEIPVKSIAVLPFINMSDDAANEYFSDGISEEILNMLAKLPGLHVTSRSSAFQFKGDDIDVPTVAKQLGVAHVLEGSVRKAGNRVRITAQLIDADADRHMWSETYDRELDDIFAIQDEIAAAVVGALQETLLGTAQATDLDASQRTDSGAYVLYLRARHQLWKRRPEPLGEAEALFEQAISVDPDYAPAYAGLALTMIFQVNSSPVDPVIAYARADTAIARAIALDAVNAEALAAKGLLRMFQGRDHEAREALERAVSLNPNDARFYTWLNNATSDPIKSLALAQQAYALEPVARVVTANLFWELLNFGRYEEALELARKFQSLYPESGWSYNLRGNVHAARGRLDRAVKSMYNAYRTAPDQIWGFEDLPYYLMVMGELDLAEDWIEELFRIAPASRYLLILRTTLMILRGQPERGIQLFAEASARYDDPWFDHGLGYMYMVSGDFEAARRVIEQAQPNLAQDPPIFDPDIWQQMVDYALILQRTGSPQRAGMLLTKARALVEAQIAAGVVRGPRGPLLVSLAAIRTLQGQSREALASLRTAAQQGELNCSFCLKFGLYYDSLRGETGFAELLAGLDSKLAVQRQQLADEGLLLTPEQVLQMENFEYDPFVE
jgi:TolB-like protein/Flp pilus assembly protein TadD